MESSLRQGGEAQVELFGGPYACYRLAEAEWFENRLKAERARFLDRRERRAKPETEPLLSRWDKSGMFLNHSAGDIHTAFEPLCLSPIVERRY
jgi:hypothetical protein